MNNLYIYYSRFVRVIMLVASIVAISGCASYEISSIPARTEVYADNKYMGGAPVEFKRFLPVCTPLTVSKEGYYPYQVMLSFSFGKTYILAKLTQKEPVSFVRTMDPCWASVELRDNVTFEKAWESIADLIVKRFDIEVMSKENGYLRTTWLNSWTGSLREDYRVRVTVKFAPDRKTVEVKSEANYHFNDEWSIGSDTALLQTLKTDIMGTVGRATR